jgi:predicted nuclease with TOPRIM domain
MFSHFSIQTVDSCREESLHQENSSLREQLSFSLNQTAELSFERDHLKQELTELSSLSNHQKNRLHRLKRSHRQLKEELRILQGTGRQEDQIKIQELSKSVKQLQRNYQHVLSSVHANNLK